MPYDPVKQKEYGQRWLTRLKLDPERYEAYRERVRARDRARGRRKSKYKGEGWGGLRRRAKSVEGQQWTRDKGPRPNRPATETTGVLRESYHLTRAGERVIPERIRKLRTRRANNRDASRAPWRLSGASGGGHSASKSPSTESH